MLLGVDVGGTFTDAALALDDGRLITAKAPTTPADQSQGVIAAVRGALAAAGAAFEDVAFFAHGMTVATNALLEGRGARTALVATEGFRDLIALGRQNRPELYRLCARRPEPLAGDELRFEARERMTPEGPLIPLTEAEAEAVSLKVAASAPESVAVVLLHAYRHPEHELQLAGALARALPEAHVSLSHQVVGTFREFERAATTEIDAALTPLLASYLRALARSCRQLGLPEPAIMQSNGGVATLERAAARASVTVLSGPAGGAAGAAFAARASGFEDALCFDMGGTSCDVCVVDRGAVREDPGGEIAGRPLAVPMLAVHTVGAGGGSIAWRDPGGALRVGPRSAGADPGPACYGRGGGEPTVTDAHLLLGHLADGRRLAAGLRLDRTAAESAIGALARELAMEPLACARGILRVATGEMVRALRVVTVQRGVDPRRYALVAFGGAGPLHATAIADELGIGTVLCPRASGVLAAVGLIASPARRDAQRSVLLGGAALTESAVRACVAELAAEALAGSPAGEAELQTVFEMRYRGQGFELPVSAPLDHGLATLRERFEQAHEQRYGYRDERSELELVTIRVSSVSRAAAVELTGAGGVAGPSGRRRAWFGESEHDAAVIAGPPGAGVTVTGPAIVDLAEATLLVPPGWAGAADDAGTIVLRRQAA